MADNKSTKGRPLSLADISAVAGIRGEPSEKKIADWIKNLPSLKELNSLLAKIKEINKKEEDRLATLLKIQKISKKYLDEEDYALEIIEEEVKSLETIVRSKIKLKDTTKAWTDELNKTRKVFDVIIKQNAEIFRISHDMQLAANVTWKEYTKLYEGAYQSARKVNEEINKSLYTAKDMIQTQNRLLGTGWRDISTSALTGVSTSVALLQRTLGDIDERLATSFQIPFRQFGEETDKMIVGIGNRLDAFSETFGVKIGALQNVVADMMASNSFIARNNMQAQITANESLIKAAALSGAVGVDRVNFITGLAGTAQFGTMEEMAQIYQGGALLQGFNTERFQQQMVGLDYEGATTDLLTSISRTLNNLDDHYIRAEYMQRIGSTFGLDRDDLLLIMQNSENINNYSEKLREKMEDMDTSMVDELRDLKMTLPDRLTTWIGNTRVSQAIGSILSEYGLYGTSDYLKSIYNILRTYFARDLIRGGKSGGSSIINAIKGTGTQATAAQSNRTVLGSIGNFFGPSTGARVARGGLGTAGLAVTQLAGRSIQTNENLSDSLANIGGGATNILGGAGTGALAGSAFGPIGTAIGTAIGAGAGIVNTIVGKREREESALEAIENRVDSMPSGQAAQPAGDQDAIVAAINEMNQNLTQVLNGNFQESRRFETVLETYRKTTTRGTPVSGGIE